METIDEAKQKEYELKLLKVIEENKICYLEHAFGYTSFSKKTAYNHGLHELPTIKEAIEKNRAKGKSYMVNNWIASKNPLLQIAAYRLLATSEEHKKLNQNYVEEEVQKDRVYTINIVEPKQLPEHTEQDNEEDTK
jgi:hypothetical protein